MMLSVQLPFTIFMQVHLTSSEKVMGKYKNTLFSKITIFILGVIVSALNVALLISLF
jgi:manganese transport protein